MQAEVMRALAPHPGGVYLDGTVGGGGHASAILELSGPDGRLLGCDRDAVAVEAARARLSERFAGRFEIRQGKFGELGSWVAAMSCDGALVDLGVSSHQLDCAERGFSFQQDGPLDMRMDRGQAMTAATFLNEVAEEELSRALWELGGERASRRIARAICAARERRPFATTSQLASLVEQVVPKHGRTHPATRVFQALRMVVNRELEELRAGLEVIWSLLKPGARFAVITFHSGEDRVVKDFGRRLARDYTYSGPVDVPELRAPVPPQLRWVTRKAILPTEEETAQNPRARSAQLRLMEKL
jgi:16S rRNA (cytosine1402-N4)-methyltransferase